LNAALVVGLAAVALTAVAASAQAAPGDVYVADRSTGDGDVWKWGPSGGEATSLASFPGGSPYGLTLGPDGVLYVADEDEFVYRVDRNTGAKTVLASTGAGSNPIDVAFDARGRLFMADYNDDSISIVDLATGALTPFGAPSASDGYNSLAIKRDGTVFVSDESDDALYSYTPQGVRSTIAENDPVLADADGLLLTPDERYLYVGSYDRAEYVRYDLRDGSRVVLPTNGDPYNSAFTLDGRIIYTSEADSDVKFASLDGAFLGVFSADTDLDTPRGIAVEPPLCGGRFPTVVGTPRGDVLRGSQFADVFLTQGGKDKVKALGGRDIVCGGPGRDTLIGGAGNDKLLGQGGRDVLRGGKGKDKLKGGAGKDVQRQ
jgi:sugar lactone lactonase YvrE